MVRRSQPIAPGERQAMGPPSGPCAAAVFTPSILAASASREHWTGLCVSKRARRVFPQGGRTACFRSVRPGAIAAQYYCPNETLVGVIATP
jgi:hypothetical protein